MEAAEAAARELGGRGGRGEGGACTVTNVKSRWADIDRALNAVVRISPRTAHDVAFTLVQALQSPDASPQFLRAGGTYYRQLYEVNPKIPPDWRDWNPRARQW